MCVTGEPDEGWPFYCLALAWAIARAWGVHGDRVRSCPGWASQFASEIPPPPPSSRPGWATQFASTIHTPPTTAHSIAATSGTVSGAMSSSPESDSGTAKSNVGDSECSEADWTIAD